MPRLLILALMLLPFTLRAQDAAQLERGKYLAEQVALCGDCHSPRDEHGQFVRERWLQGATLRMKPTVPVPNWAFQAPSLVGMRDWSDDDSIKFLMTGVRPGGLPVSPPMPPYRFNRLDAAAVTYYLKSLSEVPPAPQPTPAK